MLMRTFFFVILCFPVLLLAQSTGTIRGFVYELESEEPIMFCNIVIPGTNMGTVSDDNGYFVISDIPLNKEFKIEVSFIGYKKFEENIKLSNEDVVLSRKYFLETETVKLSNVQVSAERQEMKNKVNASVIQLTSKVISQLPSMGGEPDLAQFLQVLPGVIFTGDQGGQLYIRGGAPIHNKVLLDGMTIYNPFHSIGFFSVFDTDIIKKVDVYTGGFGGEYGGRISSIMDIQTRDGNKKRLSGKLTSNTFASKLLVEGPIFKSNEKSISNSFILSAKSSYLDKTSESFYSYVADSGLPYSFSDLYSKFSFFSKNGSKVNIYGFNFSDNVNYVNLTELGWNTYGFGSNIVLVPSSAKMLVEGRVSYSKYDIFQEDVGAPRNNSDIAGFNLGLDFSYFISQKHELKYGVEALGYSTELAFRNAIGTLIEEKDHSTEFAGYISYKLNDNRLILNPSIRFQNYTSLGELSIEPRVGLKYNFSEKIRLKSSFGLFSQNLMSTSSDRDVVNLFSGFLASTTSLPDSFNEEIISSYLQKAYHYVLGLEYDLIDNMILNLEGYVKNFSQLISENKNQIFPDTPEFENEPDNLKKEFIIERGSAVGCDLLIKYFTSRLSIWTVYSFGIVERQDEIQSYYPHYDRRHNFNFVSSYLLDKKETWEVSIRWNYGSGFPFTKTQGYYESISFENGSDINVNTENGSLAVIYSELNTGRLPDYHRLDLSIKKKHKFSKYNILEWSLGITNCYDRSNIFYYDRIQSIRVDQLPIMPTLGLNWTF